MASKLVTSFDYSAKERRSIEEKAKQRAVLRAEFIKEMSNPYRHAYGGFLEDIAMLRYDAQRTFASEYKYFKPNTKTFGMFCAYIIIPTLAFTYLGYRVRGDFDHKCRTGQVSYAERNWKFA